MAKEAPIVGGIYKHWKQGDLYEVVSVKGMGSDGVEKVYYKPLYDCPIEMFDRPLDQWFDQVEPNITRFTLVDHPPVDIILDQVVPALRRGGTILQSVGVSEEGDISLRYFKSKE